MTTRLTRMTAGGFDHVTASMSHAFTRTKVDRGRWCCSTIAAQHRSLAVGGHQQLPWLTAHMVRDVTCEVLHHWITNPRAARVQRATVRQTIRDISHLDDRGPNWELDPPCWLLNDDVVPAIGQTLTRTFAGEQVTFNRRGARSENQYVQLTFRGVDGTQYRAVSTW